MGWHPYLVSLMCWTALFFVTRSFANTCTNDSIFEMTNSNATDLDMLKNCSKLIYVNVSFNQINILGNDTFENLYSAEILDLSHNKLTELPNNLFQVMRKLKHLNISNNQLKTLPLGFFKNKPALISVDLSRNTIEHIPLSVFKQFMPKIYEVNLQHNLLTAFEPWALVGQMICFMDVRYNNISTFTNNDNWTYPGNEYRRQATSCRHNYVQTLPFLMAFTDLRHNSLTTWEERNLLQYGISYEESYAFIGEFLNMRDNPLYCDCSWYNLTHNFAHSFYGFSSLKGIDFRCTGPPELFGKRIMKDIQPYEFVCNLTTDCPSGCHCQDQPARDTMVINCEGAGLTEIPNSVPMSRFKITMNLANNSIRHLRNVTYLNRVKTFTASNNEIEEIPTFFIETLIQFDVWVVDFRNNSLTSVPKSMQSIKYQNAKIGGNKLKCCCDMLWMVEWIQIVPEYMHDDKQLSCTFNGDVHRILDLTANILECHNVTFIIMTVVLSIALACIIGLLVTAKRCPYETKVLLFRIFRIHPKDRYAVDNIEDTMYDMYVSFDDDDDYVRQWVMKVLFKKLECQKPFYKLSTFVRNGALGPEAESRLDLIDKSKRLLMIVSKDSETRRWWAYELFHAERLEHNDGRILFILYDKTAVENASKEPLLALLGKRKVFRPSDRLLWSKLRYEMPSVKRASPLHENKGNATNNEMRMTSSSKYRHEF